MDEEVLRKYRADGYQIADYLLDRSYLRFMLRKGGIVPGEFYRGDGKRYNPTVYTIVDGIEIGLYQYSQIKGRWRCPLCRATCTCPVYCVDDLHYIHIMRDALCRCKRGAQQ